MSVHGRLIILKRNEKDGSSFPLTGNCKFGRGEDCDIRIQLPTVSQYHAAITVKGEKLLISNLSRANVTLLNGKELSTPAALKDQDIITIADRHFRFENADAPHGSPGIGKLSLPLKNTPRRKRISAITTSGSQKENLRDESKGSNSKMKKLRKSLWPNSGSKPEVTPRKTKSLSPQSLPVKIMPPPRPKSNKVQIKPLTGLKHKKAISLKDKVALKIKDKYIKLPHKKVAAVRKNVKRLKGKKKTAENQPTSAMKKVESSPEIQVSPSWSPPLIKSSSPTLDKQKRRKTISHLGSLEGKKSDKYIRLSLTPQISMSTTDYPSSKRARLSKNTENTDLITRAAYISPSKTPKSTPKPKKNPPKTVPKQRSSLRKNILQRSIKASKSKQSLGESLLKTPSPKRKQIKKSLPQTPLSDSFVNNLANLELSSPQCKTPLISSPPRNSEETSPTISPPSKLASSKKAHERKSKVSTSLIVSSPISKRKSAKLSLSPLLKMTPTPKISRTRKSRLSKTSLLAKTSTPRPASPKKSGLSLKKTPKASISTSPKVTPAPQVASKKVSLLRRESKIIQSSALKMTPTSKKSKITPKSSLLENISTPRSASPQKSFSPSNKAPQTSLSELSSEKSTPIPKRVSKQFCSDNSTPVISPSKTSLTDIIFLKNTPNKRMARSSSLKIPSSPIGSGRKSLTDGSPIPTVSTPKSKKSISFETSMSLPSTPGSSSKQLNAKLSSSRSSLKSMASLKSPLRKSKLPYTPNTSLSIIDTSTGSWTDFVASPISTYSRFSKMSTPDASFSPNSSLEQTSASKLSHGKEYLSSKRLSSSTPEKVNSSKKSLRDTPIKTTSKLRSSTHDPSLSSADLSTLALPGSPRPSLDLSLESQARKTSGKKLASKSGSNSPKRLSSSSIASMKKLPRPSLQPMSSALVTSSKKIPRRSSLKADYTRVSGIKRIFRREKIATPDYTNTAGVKRIFSKTSPTADLTHISGIKQMFRGKQSKTPDYTNVVGVKQLFRKSHASTPNYNNVEGLKNLFAHSPTNSYTNMSGVKSLLRSPKMNNDTRLSGVGKLFSTPTDPSVPKKGRKRKSNEVEKESMEEITSPKKVKWSPSSEKNQGKAKSPMPASQPEVSLPKRTRNISKGDEAQNSPNSSGTMIQVSKSAPSPKQIRITRSKRGFAEQILENQDVIHQDSKLSKKLDSPKATSTRQTGRNKKVRFEANLKTPESKKSLQLGQNSPGETSGQVESPKPANNGSKQNSGLNKQTTSELPKPKRVTRSKANLDTKSSHNEDQAHTPKQTKPTESQANSPNLSSISSKTTRGRNVEKLSGRRTRNQKVTNEEISIDSKQPPKGKANNKKISTKAAIESTPKSLRSKIKQQKEPEESIKLKEESPKKEKNLQTTSDQKEPKKRGRKKQSLEATLESAPTTKIQTPKRGRPKKEETNPQEINEPKQRRRAAKVSVPKTPDIPKTRAKRGKKELPMENVSEPAPKKIARQKEAPSPKVTRSRAAAGRPKKS